jgi:hypothetical protein
MVQSENDLSTEALLNRAFVPAGAVPAGTVMVPWQQYGTSAAIANSAAETSVLNTAKVSPGVSGYVYAPSTSLWASPANFLSVGVGVTGNFVGSIANTGTPTLRVRVVMKNPSTGAIVYTVADTGAVAMTSVSSSDFQIDFSSSIASIGATGSILGRCAFRYAGTIVSVPFATTTIDTTQAYLWDVLLTWGAASASNTMTLAYGQLGLI